MRAARGAPAGAGAAVRCWLDSLLAGVEVVAVLRAIQAVDVGDDSGLRSTWEEICVQIQGELSIAWGAYDETVLQLFLRRKRRFHPFFGCGDSPGMHKAE